MTAPTENRATLETRALRMLRAGDSHKDVTAATGLISDELAKLQRDFPASTPKPPRVCDADGCRALAITAAKGWAFCAEHRAKPAQQELAVASSAPTEGVPAQPATASPIGRLLEDASAHSITRVRTLAARIETDLDKLRDLITQHAEAEAAKNAELAARAAAKERVKQLEDELRAAKAALKGKTSVAPTGETVTSPNPCTTCGGPVTRAKGSAGAWPKRCASCR